MFATMRRKRRNATMKQELGLGVEHFKRAAALAAQETSATMGPKLSAAKDRVQPAASRARDTATTSWESTVATLTPLVAAAGESLWQTGRDGSKKARKSGRDVRKRAGRMTRKPKNRRSKLMGLAMAGVAVGAGAAYLARRRKAAQWDEYDPDLTMAAAVESIGGADDAAFEPAEPVTGPVTPDRTPTADQKSDTAGQNGTLPQGPEVARSGKQKS
ncbi:hypothetical protein EV385_2921 [Krasilnikovia cinnamomea]|uniref:Uncharacterized protein n=1 Tax=Krasilnikovia cinnamomea TaxID=349313 RepID=A0A4Q7ZJP8_9ACTN|nr:hypothetical protein [Krasilnikovia cinnamomea]RZU51122.1 hypothetical protein EV385_2921 [Krasilnikovia cinnamomea]